MATPEHVENVYNAVYEKACDGCVSAMKLYLQYLLGKPTEMPNPDHVDLDEWELYAKATNMQKKSPDVMSSPDHRFGLEIARTMRPVMAEEMRKEMLGGLKEMDKTDREMEKMEEEYAKEQQRKTKAKRTRQPERTANAKREAKRKTQESAHSRMKQPAPLPDGFLPDRPPLPNGFLPGESTADFAVANQLPPSPDGESGPKTNDR